MDTTTMVGFLAVET